MRVLVIGGAHQTIPIELSMQETQLRQIAAQIGAEIARAGYDLIVCSAYPRSADLEALRGWAATIPEVGVSHRSRTELHYPDDPNVAQQVTNVLSELEIGQPNLFRHPASYTIDGSLEITYSWMLAQLAALDRSDVVVAIGGNPGGSANLLLQLAATRRVPVLPLSQLGGAAAAFLDRNRYLLGDILGDSVDLLQASEQPIELLPLLKAVTERSSRGPRNGGSKRFFISYPRARPAEADYAETILRRRGFEVFRDDRDFASGEPVVAVIESYIRRADVFIAFWCQEYACSPWCYDEMQLALDLMEQGQTHIAIICIDNTRVVPLRARNLINYACASRSELEAVLLKLTESFVTL